MSRSGTRATRCAIAAIEVVGISETFYFALKANDPSYLFHKIYMAVETSAEPSTGTQPPPFQVVSRHDIQTGAQLNCCSYLLQYHECYALHKKTGLGRLFGEYTRFKECFKYKKKYRDCVEYQTRLLGEMGHTGGSDPSLDILIEKKCEELYDTHFPMA